MCRQLLAGENEELASAARAQQAHAEAQFEAVEKQRDEAVTVSLLRPTLNARCSLLTRVVQAADRAEKKRDWAEHRLQQEEEETTTMRRKVTARRQKSTVGSQSGNC